MLCYHPYVFNHDVIVCCIKQTMLCYHPHGMLCIGFSWNGVHAPEFREKNVTW